LFFSSCSDVEDAQEFYSFLLDQLQEEYVGIQKFVRDWKTLLGLDEQSHSTETDADEWKEIGKGAKKLVVTQNLSLSTSPYTKLFSGRLRTQINVAARATDTLSFQPFYSIHLDISSSYINSVSTALECSMSSSIIQGYKKRTGQLKATSIQTLDGENLPNVLVLHFKRFTHENGKLNKINKTISFESKLPFHSSYASNLIQEPNYILHSVIIHHGKTAIRGHYTVCIRNLAEARKNQKQKSQINSQKQSSTNQRGQPSTRSNTKYTNASDDDELEQNNPSFNERWYHYNDTNIQPVQTEFVYKQQAYILIYVKQNETN
jgi:ubiquitin C-terminal hydrolase